MPITPINVTLPTSEPDTVPLGICTRCGYPGPVGMKCTNPRGCERVADPFAAFIGHVPAGMTWRARRGDQVLAYFADVSIATHMTRGMDALGVLVDALDPAAIVKP